MNWETYCLGGGGFPQKSDIQKGEVSRKGGSTIGPKEKREGLQEFLGGEAILDFRGTSFES